MKLSGVECRGLVMWLALGAGCTEPTYETLGDAGTPGAADAGALLDGATQPEPDAPFGPTVERADGGVDPDNRIEPDAASADAAEQNLDGGQARDAGSLTDLDATAGDSGGSSGDGGASGAVLPGWAKPLLGRYFKQSISVGLDTTIGMPVVTSERSLVTIVEEANTQLVMQIQTCAFNSQWYDQSIRFALVKPSALPAFKLRIILGDAPHFSTETFDRAVGFDPSRQASCKNMGQRIDKFGDQLWLVGSACTCATFPELPPQSPSDCRLTDPDTDRKPGVVISSTTGVFNFSVAMATSLKIVDGVVAQDREHTLREQGRANVSCVNSGEDGCTLGAPVPCGDVVTDLRPLADDASCATVLAYNLPVGTLPVDKCPATSR